MPSKPRATDAAPSLRPRFGPVELALIDEPTLAVRASMDDGRLAELVQSMSVLGLLQPILLVPRDARYEIVAGHRRYLAARELGWEAIPAIIYPERGIAVEAARVHENIMREDLNPAEEATYYAELLERFSLDEAGLCGLVRRSPDYIADRLRLLRGDPQVLEALRRDRISFATARELNKVTDDPIRLYFLDNALRGGVSSRVVAQWVVDWRASRAAQPAVQPAASASPDASMAQPWAPACCLCGGNLDPYNLENVFIHKWELAQLRDLVRKAAEGKA